jgi:uncharacterized protein YbjT (DUF2867 family)
MVEHTVAEPFVDADDIADVAVAALLDKEYVGRVLELTGPQLLIFEEVLDGRNAYVTSDVESVLGRAARSIDDLDRGEQS